MAATIDFHTNSKSKYFLSPDFTAISLSDEEPISKALDIVLRAKKKSVLPAERDILVKNISSFAKGEDIGSLRSLQDFEWKQLDVPLICRIYLKHLIIQSCALTKDQLLECDFNSDWRDPEEIDPYIAQLNQQVPHTKEPNLWICRKCNHANNRL
eukprot:317184_1